MERQRNLAQELTDHIIGLLHDSPGDWPACALVCHSWVYAAQAHIFRRISFTSASHYTNDRLWSRFLETLDESPHLIRHVRRIDVEDDTVSTEIFIALCNFPFTHLEQVDFMFSPPTTGCTLALQQLLSCSTLHRVRMYYDHPDPSVFLQIWERCSSSVKHLELIYLQTGEAQLWSFPPTQHSLTSIRLESLALQVVAKSGLRDWLMHPHCPLDFSDLKALSIVTDTDLFVSRNLMPALRTIQTLDLYAHPHNSPLDLSLFHALELLRIRGDVDALPWVFATLSTITASSRILKIVHYVNYDQHWFQRFTGMLP
ncbi:hypothetical protein C8R44DRAFT_882605 [Mycena epipterygia]|nr:hypothetical protein C8R44DRAFT_882605 [Mycena epipterygia]